jgi:drug/metabolite transporter (DMT)-like permease
MMSTDRPRALPPRVGEKILTDVLFLIVLLIAASNYIVCKNVLVHVPPFTLIAIRYCFAAIVISVFVLSRMRHLTRDSLMKSGMLGLVLAAATITWQLGVMHTDHIGPAAFIVSLDGLMMPMVVWLLFGTVAERRVLIAMPIALLGLGLLTLHAGMSISRADVWFIASAVGFSLHIALTHHYSKLFDPVCLTWGQMVIVCVVATVLALMLEADAVTVSAIGTVKYEMLYLVVVATALRFPLQNYAQRRASASHAAFLFMLEPIVVALMGWFFLSQWMNGRQLLGCGLILLAVIISRGKQREILV